MKWNINVRRFYCGNMEPSRNIDILKYINIYGNSSTSGMYPSGQRKHKHDFTMN